MGKIFTLTDDIKQIAMDAIDDLIDQLGKPCRLVYPGIPVPCPNCLYDPRNNKSTGIYKVGGPVPFTIGVCPFCDGKGNISNSEVDIVTFLCQWNPRAWLAVPPAFTRIPDGYVQIKGYRADLSKLRRAQYVEMQTPMSDEEYFRYTLDGEPIDQGNIIQGRYFVALLKRIAL